jgi:hypothetical protein
MQTDPNIEQKYMLLGRSDTITIMRADEGYNFDNLPIVVRLRTKDVTPEKGRNVRFTAFRPEIAPFANKNIKFQYMLDGRSSNIVDAYFNQNLEGEYIELGEIHIKNQDVFSDRVRPFINYAKGQSVAFVIIDSTLNLPFELRSIKIEYIDKFKKKTKKVGA